MLEKFRQAKQAEIDGLKEIQAKGLLPPPFEGFRPSFSQALLRAKGIAVIAEYKRASPSKGDIRLDMEPEDVAGAYSRGGASAMSVLTEESYFKGELDFLERMAEPGLPLLRKDFLLDPLQIIQTAATRASALLLIARMVDVDLLKELQEMTVAQGMEAVVEIFDHEDLAKARQAKATIIQVNNRDLDALTIDMETSARLIPEKDPAEVWISASGVTEPSHLAYIRDLGFNAALIGSFLMAESDPSQALSTLIIDAQPKETS